MLNAPIVFYLGSRAFSAAGNLLAVAIFTRLVGPAEYGQYLFMYAWSTIVFGFATQWIGFAYFGVYKTQRINEYVDSLVRLTAIALVMLVAGFAAMMLLGFWQPEFLISVCILVICLSIYFNALQVSRTKLNSRAGAISMIMRAGLTMALGSLVLWWGGGPTGLAFAVSFANLIAAIPSLMSADRIDLLHGSRAASLEILKYGWPLILSTGLLSLGLTIDRLILGQFLGTAALGIYGVLYDFVRQSFYVVGESISFSMITTAKQYAHEGNVEASTHELRTAFNASYATAALGAAFFIVFGDQVIRVLLGSQFHEDVGRLLPIFSIAFGIWLMGQFYFGQAIYFSNASFLEPILQTTLVLVSAAISIWLIPIYGTQGAAFAILAGVSVYCIGYIVIGRRYFRMPIDFAGVSIISMFAVLFVFAAWMLGRVAPSAAISQVIEAAVFVGLSALVVHRFDLLRHTSTGTT